MSIPEQDGYTCIHGAAFNGSAETVKLLLEKGIERDDFHKDGQIFLDYLSLADVVSFSINCRKRVSTYAL